MRKLTIILSLFASFVPMFAQEHTERIVFNSGAFDNTFISTGAGVNAMVTPGMGIGFNGKSSFVLDFSAGRWFTPSFGVRVGYQGTNFKDTEEADLVLPGANAVIDADGNYTVRTEYAYVHSDLLWNFSNSIFGYNPQRTFSLIPYGHIGYQWLYNSFNASDKLLKRDYMAGVGIIGDIRVYDRISFYADLRSAYAVRHMLDDAVDRKNLAGLSFYAIAGLTYDLDNTPWFTRKSTYSGGFIENKFLENTFIGLSGGLNSYYVLHESVSLNANPMPMFEVFLGKWFTPSIGLRLGASRSHLSHWAERGYAPNGYLKYVPGIFRGEEAERSVFGFSNLHADLLWNPFATYSGYDHHRFFSIYPYASFAAGFSTSMIKKNVFRHDFMIGLGFVNNLRVNDYIDINVDIRNYYISDRRYGNTNMNEGFIPSVELGAVYKIDNTPWTKVSSARNPQMQKLYKTQWEGELLNRKFLENAFISLYSGTNFVIGGGEGRFVAPGMDLSLGKWVTTSFGLRVGMAGLNLSSNNAEISMSFPHLDIMIDPINLIGGYKKERKYDFVPYLQFGALSSYTNDETYPEMLSSSFASGAGVLSSYQLGRNAQINLDLRLLTARTETITGIGDGNRILGSSLLGLTYFFSNPGWLYAKPFGPLGDKDRGENVERVAGIIANSKIFDNSFISFAGGVNTFGFSVPTSAVDLNIGKWLSPALGIRFGYQGRKLARNDSDIYSKVNADYAHSDFMWNPRNTIEGYMPDRVYSPALYIHGGLVFFKDPNGTLMGNELGVGAGFLNSFHVADRMDLYFDLKSTFTKDQYTDSENRGNTPAISALAGISYNFGRSEWQFGSAHKDYADNIGSDRTRYWAISTNLLDLADLLTFNVEAQYALSRHVSLSMIAKNNSLIFKDRENNKVMDRKSLTSLGVKYWPWYVYSGVWAKAFAQVEGYSRQAFLNTKEYEQGDRYGAGLSIGYSLIINKWFNIDAGIGVWGGYKSCRTAQTDSFFIDMADLSVSAMFVF